MREKVTYGDRAARWIRKLGPVPNDRRVERDTTASDFLEQEGRGKCFGQRADEESMFWRHRNAKLSVGEAESSAEQDASTLGDQHGTTELFERRVGAQDRRD